tara:strand:+ start:188 stop:610 length:423 start_codon:yes stop_codon:yes gene_type:complete
MAGVVGKALRGFGKALAKKGDGKAIKSVPIAKRLTQRRSDTEKLFKIRQRSYDAKPSKSISEGVKKTSAINDRFDKAQKARKDYNKNLKKKVIGGGAAVTAGVVGAHEGAKKKFPKYKKVMESDVVIKDGKLGLRPKKKK